MTLNDLEVGGGTLVVLVATIAFLNWRWRVAVAKDNEDKLAATEANNKIAVMSESSDDLKSELSKDLGRPSGKS